MNQIKSTAILRKDIFIILKKISDITGKSVSKVLSDCFKHIVLHNSFNHQPTIGSSIKYQKRSKDLFTIHYQIDDKTYETCLDLKKIHKKSLSRIINETILEVYNSIKMTTNNNKDTIVFYLTFLATYIKRTISYNFRIINNQSASSCSIIINIETT
jgi:hypothetical protein